MKVLLLKHVPKVGKKDDIVDVADGYATNVLFIKKLAVPATKHAVEEMQKKNTNAVTYNKIHAELFEKELARIQSMLTLRVKANEKGSLFSRVDEKAIAQALKNLNIELDEKNIHIAHEIKELGTHTIEVADRGGKKYPLTIIIEK